MAKINKITLDGLEYEIEDSKAQEKLIELESILPDSFKTINGESIVGEGNIDLSDDYATKEDLSDKQDTLISGNNIKTVNGLSLVGPGNIDLATLSGSSSADAAPSGSSLNFSTTEDSVILEGYTIGGEKILVPISAATKETAGVMSAEDKIKVNSGFVGTTTQSQPIELNSYTEEGVYNFLNATFTDGSPILSNGVVSGRLTVLVTQENDNKVVTQVLNLNNHQGGEGNIYIRSNQNGTWKPWGKLQTNIEVGQITPNDMSNLIDNGIYSGVCVDGTTVETFVLIVINNYLAASQAGFGSYISQLKYSIDLNRGNTVKTRSRDAYGIWNEWSEIGGSTYELPKATTDILGGVKLGTTTSIAEGYKYYVPLIDIPSEMGDGVGIRIDDSVLRNTAGGLTIKTNYSLGTGDNGLSVKLGTINEFHTIPCCIGTMYTSLDTSKWDTPHVGIPYNREQFCLKGNGLNLKDGIITANKSDKLEDYFPDLSDLEDGIYEFYGILPNNDTAGTVWRYIYEEMECQGDKCVYCKLVIYTNLPDFESGHMFVFGNGKAASIVFDKFTGEITTANIL